MLVEEMLRTILKDGAINSYYKLLSTLEEKSNEVKEVRYGLMSWLSQFS